MRQAGNELPDVVADFVARHPDIVARLAGVASTATPDSDALGRQREHFRAYAAERIETARGADAAAAGQDFLARLRAS
jgi:hypothetical protein